MYNLGVLILEIATGEKMSPHNEDNPYSATLFANNVRQTYLINNIVYLYYINFLLYIQSYSISIGTSKLDT
jgi:hypothetical protein